MATANISYQDIGTAIAITSADALGNGAWCSSALVDNQTNLFVDVLFGGSLQTGTQSGGTINLYIAASWDGTDFTGGCTAGDGVITWGTTGDTHIGGESDLFSVTGGDITVNASDDDKDVTFGPFSVAATCGGTMPLEWCIVLENNTGAALHATGTNNYLSYTGIEYDSV